MLSCRRRQIRAAPPRRLRALLAIPLGIAWLAVHAPMPGMRSSAAIAAVPPSDRSRSTSSSPRCAAAASATSRSTFTAGNPPNASSFASVSGWGATDIARPPIVTTSPCVCASRCFTFAAAVIGMRCDRIPHNAASYGEPKFTARSQ